MKLRLKTFISILASVWLVCVLVSCLQQPTPPLRVSTVLWPGFENLYLADGLGYYKDAPIRLLNYPSTAEQLRAYRNKEIEVASITISDALLLATTNPDIRIVLVTDTSYGGDVVLAKPEIKDLPGLKNRRIGVEATPLEAYMLTRALGKVGMTPKDVKVVSLGIAEHEQAFTKGAVDAVVTYEPVRSKLLASGARLLFDSRQIPGEIVDVLVVSEEALNTHRNSLEVLLKGWFKALDYSKQNPQDAARRVAPREGLTAEQFLEALKGIRIPDLQENQKLLSKVDTSLLNGSKRLSEVMLENKLLSTVVDPTALLDDQLIKNLKY